MLRRFFSHSHLPVSSGFRGCSGATIPGASRAAVSTGDVECDLFLMGCSTSRNPLKRFVIGPLGRGIMAGRPAIAIIFLSGVAWGFSDYMGQSWEIEAQIGWATEAFQEKARREARLKAACLPLPKEPEAKVMINILNPYQIAAAAFFGATVMGLGGRYWYLFLDATFKSRFSHLTTYNRTVGKLSAEFLFWYPFTLLSYWALMGGAVLGQPLGDILSEGLGEQLLPTLVTEAPIWIPAQFINFRFVPAQLQVFYVCIVAFAENIIMGYLRAEAMSDEEFQREQRPSS